MKRGVSLALNTVGIAILVLVVVLVLGFIFIGYITKLVGIEDPCGYGIYEEYACSASREGEGFTHCFVTKNTDRYCRVKVDGVDENAAVYCCRT